MGTCLEIDLLARIKADIDADPDGFRSECERAKLPSSETFPGLLPDMAQDDLVLFVTPGRAIHINGHEAT